MIDLLGGGSGTRRQWSASHGNLTYSEKAIMDDLALNDYFQAFPEQAKSRYEADVSSELFSFILHMELRKKCLNLHREATCLRCFIFA